MLSTVMSTEESYLFFQFNFVGKILGPQGNTIKRLQEETGAKISVLGKGSMRDKAKVGLPGQNLEFEHLLQHLLSPFVTCRLTQ